VRVVDDEVGGAEEVSELLLRDEPGADDHPVVAAGVDDAVNAAPRDDEPVVRPRDGGTRFKIEVGPLPHYEMGSDPVPTTPRRALYGSPSLVEPTSSIGTPTARKRSTA